MSRAGRKGPGVKRMVDHLIETVLGKEWGLIGRGRTHHQDGNLKARTPQVDAFFGESNTQPGRPGLDQGSGRWNSAVAVRICLDHSHDLDMLPHAIPNPTKIPGQSIQGYYGLGYSVPHGTHSLMRP